MTDAGTAVGIGKIVVPVHEASKCAAAFSLSFPPHTDQSARPSGQSERFLPVPTPRRAGEGNHAMADAGRERLAGRATTGACAMRHRIVGLNLG